jgi:hypothetical protein
MSTGKIYRWLKFGWCLGLTDHVHAVIVWRYELSQLEKCGAMTQIRHMFHCHGTGLCTAINFYFCYCNITVFLITCDLNFDFSSDCIHFTIKFYATKIKFGISLILKMNVI